MARDKYDRDNVFAKILRGELPCTKVFESEHSLAFENIAPMAPQHILVIPKQAYTCWDDFSAHAADEEMVDFVRAVGEVARQVGLAPEKGGGGYRLISNIGPAAAQEVHHLHVHVIGGTQLGQII